MKWIFKKISPPYPQLTLPWIWFHLTLANKIILNPHSLNQNTCSDCTSKTFPDGNSVLISLKKHPSPCSVLVWGLGFFGWVFFFHFFGVLFCLFVFKQLLFYLEQSTTDRFMRLHLSQNHPPLVNIYLIFPPAPLHELLQTSREEFLPKWNTDTACRDPDPVPTIHYKQQTYYS